MRTTTSIVGRAATLGVAVLLVALGAVRGNAGETEPSAAQTDETFAWASACKSCHSDIYAAWQNTKHARALSRLSSGNQQKECIGCHVTGPKQRVEKGGTVVNGGIQCESCHGAAAAHAADPGVKTGLVRRPDEALCKECHNEKSPHFRGFYYDAMITVSHYVRK
jgi:cytochrome c554/c'-like protein